MTPAAQNIAVPARSDSLPNDAGRSLADLAQGVDAEIHRLDVAPDEGAMLRAMGLAEGRTVRVLRRAPGGDPLHVRLSCGGEFAVSRPLAASVRVEPAA
jgi:Fe2+ transport system protein FeoA